MANGPTTPDVPGALARGWPIILACVALFAVASLAVAVQWPTTYEATAALSVTQSPESGDESGTFMETQRLTVTSSKVLKPTSAPLGLDVAELRDSLTVLVPRESQVIEISATAPTAEKAAARANGVARAYSSYWERRGTGSVESQREQLKEQIQRLRTVLDKPRNPVFRDAVLAQVAVLQAERAAITPTRGRVTMLTSASPPTSTATPPAVVFALGGAVFGLLVGAVLALLRDRTGRTRRARP